MGRRKAYVEFATQFHKTYHSGSRGTIGPMLHFLGICLCYIVHFPGNCRNKTCHHVEEQGCHTSCPCFWIQYHKSCCSHPSGSNVQIVHQLGTLECYKLPFLVFLPSQSCPPKVGGGLSQNRSLVCHPVPHDTGHWLQEVQRPQLPAPGQ